MNIVTQLFRAGVPTALDVEKLRERFGVPEPGMEIAHEEIEETVALHRKALRYKVILTAWRKKLDREHNVLLKAIPGKGYVAMDGHARVDHTGGLYKAGLRRMARAESVAARTDRSELDAGEIRVLEHVQATAGALRAQAAVASRRLEYPEPGLPRAVAR